MISRTNEPEVRLQSTWFNSPEIVAVNVHELAAGQSQTVDASALGTPLRSLEELPEGDYYVQAVLNVYSQVHRADGHTLWVHLDRGEGQQFNKSPGNLYSEVQKLHIRGAQSYRLTLNRVIPAIQPPLDTQWVKYIRIQSQLLTKFWGKPIYLGAVVLLPNGYAQHPEVRYPVIYYQRGHFNLMPPFDFATHEIEEKAWDRREWQSAGFESGYAFYQSWKSDHFPRMIAVSFLDPTPLGDWSGGVNSVNNGPYGDALMTELIPEIEREFRTIRDSNARMLTGKASGGREALALLLHHPDVFGGVWVFHPWAFTFRHYFTLDIYGEDNAFVVPTANLPEWAHSASNWLPVVRPILRTPDDVPVASFQQLSQHDAVMASMAGGDCLGADDAILGPVGTDGYPQPLWSRKTGKIDPDVAAYWGEHGDLVNYLRAHWSTLGPLLVGKIHLYDGEMDHFYRNQGVHFLEDFLSQTKDPHEPGEFHYGALAADWQPMTNAELVGIMADHIVKNVPAGTDLTWKQQ